MLSRVTATSAALACKPALLDSTDLRTLPQRSGSQLTFPLNVYWFPVLSPPPENEPPLKPPPLPLPDRVAEAEVPSVGKKAERLDCSKACAWRYCASA